MDLVFGHNGHQKNYLKVIFLQLFLNLKLKFEDWMESIKKCNYHINTRKSRTWENIKFMPISSPNETLELSNMSFSLPSMPSTETTSMLLNACLEISRIGGHSTNIQIVKLYGFELSRAICHTFQSHITQNLSKIHNISGDDGILQFILDFHFLRNLLSGTNFLI